MKRAYLPIWQSDRETWELIKKHRPAYAEFLKEFNRAFGKPSPDVFYWGDWSDIGAIDGR